MGRAKTAINFTTYSLNTLAEKIRAVVVAVHLQPDTVFFCFCFFKFLPLKYKTAFVRHKCHFVLGDARIALAERFLTGTFAF